MIKNPKKLANLVRVECLKMVHSAKASHIGSALSIVDILAILYSQILKYDSANPDLNSRDRFILSKGHACCAVYATLAHCGYFDVNLLKTFAENESDFMSHISHKVPGVEFSTGSLGHGLPYAVGKAMAAKRNKQDWRTYVLTSDGELDEGSNWEAILFTGHHCLNNLTIIIDNNKLQGMSSTHEILKLDTYIQNISHLNFNVYNVDGHDVKVLKKTLALKSKKPKLIIANTIKGKGIDFMENDNLWHYKNPDLENLESLISKIK